MRNRILALILAIISVFSTTVYASDTQVTKNNKGNVPIVANAQAVDFKVIVPLCLPVDVDDYGKVTTATNARIINNSSYGIVHVTNIETYPQNNWTIISFDNDVRNEKVNTNKISMIINNCKTNSTGKFDFTAKNFNNIGYIDGNNSLGLTYDAKVPPHSAGLAGVTPMNVVFTVSWYDYNDEPVQYGPVPANVTDYYTFYNDYGTSNSYRIELNPNFKTALNSDTSYKDWVAGTALPNPGSVYNGKPVTGMTDLFNGCTATKLNLNNFDVRNVTNMAEMFKDCKSGEIDLDSFYTDSLVSMRSMFNECLNVPKLDLHAFNTSNVTDMNLAFMGCQMATTINLSSFNTSKVTDMTGMFANSTRLRSLDLSHFDTHNVHSMQSMFSYCEALGSLDLGSFDTSTCYDMSYMFQLCEGLSYVNLKSFNTANVSSMKDMFYGCEDLTSLDVSSFNTKNVSNIVMMFCYCERLQMLDLSSFDTSSLIAKSSYEYAFTGDIAVGAAYARTQADADKLNDAANMPGNFRFVVKSHA